jgi:ketosteroid isomerase-like protein
VELIRQGMEHLRRTGEPRWEDLHPQIEMHDHDIPDGGPYRGHDGWRKWEADFGEAWDSFSTEPQDYMDAGDGRVVVVARVSARGRGSGVSVEHLDGILWTVRGGKVVRLDYYHSPAEALEAAGLQEAARERRSA